MGFVAYRSPRALDLATRAAGDYVRFQCDTEADRPSTNVQDGDTAYTNDTKKMWDRAGGAWVERGDASNSGGGGGPHIHDAADINSGTFAPARIPVAAMAFCVPLWPGTFTLTNQPLADTELPATHYRQKVDLTGYTQFRVTGRVATVGAAASDLRVQYSTDDSSFANLDGSGGPEIAINTLGQKDTGWVSLAAGAIGDNRWLRVMGKDGDGAADPVVRQLCIWFR